MLQLKAMRSVIMLLTRRAMHCFLKTWSDIVKLSTKRRRYLKMVLHLEQRQLFWKDKQYLKYCKSNESVGIECFYRSGESR